MKQMKVGQTERIHIAQFAQDDAHSPGPSQVPDDATIVNITGGGSFAHGAADPSDPRAFIVTALSSGSTQLFVDVASAPFETPSNRLTLNLTVITPPADNRRTDLVSCDDPV
jgi:hypothetical protein